MAELDQVSTHSDQSTAHDPSDRQTSNYSNEKGGGMTESRTESTPQLGLAVDCIPTQHEEFRSPTGESRTEQHRLVDDLELLRAERAVSNQEDTEKQPHSIMGRTRSRNGAGTPEDAFNVPAPQQTFEAPGVIETDPPTKVLKLFRGVKKFPRAIRYFAYMSPISVILLIPVLLGRFTMTGESASIGGDGGVTLLWFGIWLEIVWLSLWAARMAMTIIPVLMGFLGKAGGASTSRKWKNIGRHLEIPFALFFWMLAVLVSFHPVVNDPNHRAPTGDGQNKAPDLAWTGTVQKVITAIFVLACMHVVEKILIQWIASSFHKRTYSSRIMANKQNIAYLVHLYEYSKQQLFREDSIFAADGNGGKGAKTPLAQLQKTARQVGNRVGDTVQRIKGDFTNQKVASRTHPRKVVSELLRSGATAQVLARRLFRTFCQPDAEVLVPEDLNPAFPTPEDAETAFSIFDRDLNGDVSCEELEAMCDEVHREKKAIAASLKDLDDVIQKLDSVFLVIIIIIAVIVFITILSSSAATALTSAGSTILGLSWLLQATAQEFLQSIIFVFVKHPFDVGDRVTVYGNTGATGVGDDYYVTAISLLYTEFKKMQGQIVQAPNSILNTLFILNHRRSQGLADVNTLKMKFGTPEHLIEELKHRMVMFVNENKRDYGNDILTEMTAFEDSYAVSVNFIFFHKSSYQNELQRLQRHNKFACKLQEEMMAVGIEQPRRVFQISGRDFPLYNTNIEPPAYEPPPHRPQSRPSETEAFPSLNSIPSAGAASGAAAARRGRGVSITLNDNPFDFQDVFGARTTVNENPALVRLRSTRQAEYSQSQGSLGITPQPHPSPIAEEANPMEGMGNSLRQMASTRSASQRRKMFSMKRAATWGRRPGGGNDMV